MATEGQPELAVSTTNWLKQHWKEAAIGAAAALAAIWYLFLRGKSQGSGNTSGVPVSPLSYGADVGSQQQAAQSAVASDTQIGQTAVANLAQKMLDQIQQSSQAELDAITKATAASNQQFAAQAQQEQQAQQGFLGTIQGLLAQITKAGQDNLTQMQAEEQAFQNSLLSVQRANGIVPSGAAAPSLAQGAQDVANWAKGLGIDVSVAQAYVNAHNGQEAPDIPTLNAWLASNHIDPTMSIQANQYKQQQGSGYQAGSQPASASSPAGGGLWKGQTDQQIQKLFQDTYGSNWQQVWNQQHAAGG